MKADLKKSQILPTDLLHYKRLFRQYADFKFFNMNMLLRISNFMSLEPVTGFTTINNFLRIFRIQIPINARIVNRIAKVILVRELNMYFNRIRMEDEALGFDQLDQYTEEELDAMCFKRGIEIDKQTKKDKI